MAKVDLSIILPCYNEGPTFAKSMAEIVRVLKKNKYRWEIIFVEDKSTDETAQTARRLAAQIKNSSVIFHKSNQGRGKSVADGIRQARGKICGYLDVDLEVSADYIPIFASEIEKGNDMAVGQRFYEGGIKSLSRYLSSKVYALAVKLLIGIPVEDTESGYKFFRRSKILPILSRTKAKHWFWDTEICARAHIAGLKISQVPVLFIRRIDKKSTVRLIPDTWHYITSLLAFRSKING